MNQELKDVCSNVTDQMGGPFSVTVTHWVMAMSSHELDLNGTLATTGYRVMGPMHTVTLLHISLMATISLNPQALVESLYLSQYFCKTTLCI
jgi:hypothetical protein